MCDVFVESEEMELEFTEILNLDAGVVIDNKGCSESGLDLDSDRDVNLSINLDKINSTVSLNSSNVLKNSSGQMESEKPNVVFSELMANNSERLIFAQINKNGIDHKFQSLVSIIKNKVDIIMISETKVDDSYPINQFQIEGYSSPFQLDSDSHGGGIMIYLPGYLPCKRIESFLLPNNVEVIEMNICKTKWLVISGYNPRKENISYFLGYISKGLDKVLDTNENFIILGDPEMHMKDFCDLYDLENLIKEPTYMFQKSK